MKVKTKHHVISHSNGWAVKKTTNTRASKVFRTKNDAVKYASNTARNTKSEIVIHNKTGRISSRKNYAK